jgi:hypothetical protein
MDLPWLHMPFGRSILIADLTVMLPDFDGYSLKKQLVHPDAVYFALSCKMP